MASFAYNALNALGAESAGQVTAPDVNAARELLRQKGLRPVSLSQVGGSDAVETRKQKRVKQRYLQVFSRQFATMIDAGLSVVSALVILEQQTDDKNLAAVIREVRSDVEGGMLLSQAMARHPNAFDRLYIAMIEAGEAAGILDTVLDRVALQIEKEMKIRRRVKGAMIYPLVVLGFAVVTLIGMLLFLVPVFQGIFDDLGGDLPTLTKGVVAASDLVRGYWFIIFPAVGLSIWGFRRWKKTPSGRQVWDRFKLRAPAGIGKVVLKVTMARFSRTLATLVAAGVDIIKALEISGPLQATGSSSPPSPTSARRCTRAFRSLSRSSTTRSSRPSSRRWSGSARRPASSRRCWTRSRTSTRTRSTPRSPLSRRSSSHS